MNLKQIEKAKDKLFRKEGARIDMMLRMRARDLLKKINKAYPQVTHVETGMGLGAFARNGERYEVEAIFSDGSEGPISQRDLWEWADWGNKIYTPKGMTQQIANAFEELVGICDMAVNDPYLSNIRVSLRKDSEK